MCVTQTAWHGGLYFPHDSPWEEMATFSCQLVLKDPPDLCVIHPLHSDICPISSQFLHPPHPPALLSPPSRSAGPFTPGAVPRDAGHERGQLVDLPEVIVWEKRLEMIAQTELGSQVTHLLHYTRLHNTNWWKLFYEVNHLYEFIRSHLKRNQNKNVSKCRLINKS